MFLFVMTEHTNLAKSLERGINVIREYLTKLSSSSGVYRMISKHSDVLYVGKAKNLKKRVTSYTYASKLPIRLQRMVSETVAMEFVTTHTEVEALLLEASLIKKFKPRYNILLKDDKSFPYIMLTEDHPFPQIKSHRGAHKRKGAYYGTYASAGAVFPTITAIQKSFKIRNCSDSYFANRSRPCLQYHIKRCSAPCVGYISEEDYKKDVNQTKRLLQGESQELLEDYARKMDEASVDMRYEEAAKYRDRIKALSHIQAKQEIRNHGIADADVFALERAGDVTCVQVFFVRKTQNLGNHPFFLRHDAEEATADVFENFILQFYQNRPVPKEIYVNEAVGEEALLVDALELHAKKGVKIHKPSRGPKRKFVEWVHRNAAQALKRYLSDKTTQKELLQQLEEMLELDTSIDRIEVYDNSHISGANMVGAMIAAGPEGFIKNSYRKYNIKQAGESDDFAMMREVMERRFGRLVDNEGEALDDHESWPDLVLIDGGKGQLSAVKEALEEVGIWDHLNVVAISKGPDRNAGREEFHIDGRPSFALPVNDPVLHYLQRLRDEAHRFAINTHRARRTSDIKKSPLDTMPGVGPKRKKALLQGFGSAKAVSQAGIEDLKKIEGISEAMAEKIYNYFH
ncbi:MAG TPA: excinuclease ABC subunit C [Rhodospirillaceae bacterium]|nr:excinuclease ABC subunit C [Rhodospirillaceae bacterium]